MQKNIRSLYYRILCIAIVPIVLLGVILIACACNRTRDALKSEIKGELRSTTYALKELYDLMGDGDYTEDINGNVYKGDYLVQGKLDKIDARMNESGIYLTFFYGNRRVDTSIVDADGNRIYGTTMDVNVYQHIYEANEEVFVNPIEIEGTQYYGYYIPIKNSDDSIVAALFAGKLYDDVQAKINNSVTIMISLSIVIVILTLILAALGVAYVVRYSAKMLQTKESIDEVKRADEAKTEFLTLMSHEIRTPINAILGMNAMVLRERPQGKIKEYSINIKDAGNTLLELVNTILDFTKIESGTMEVERSEFSLSALIDDCYNMVVMEAEAKKLNLRIEYDETTPNRLFGDVIKIKQIIVNYLTNAIKYTNEGSITIKAEYEKINHDDINLIVSVKDTGIGIDEKDREKLFTSIGRIGDSTHRSLSGGGIGLVLCKRLADIMKGTVSVESKLGYGSQFKVSIPVTVTAPGIIKDVADDYVSLTEKQDIVEEKDFEAPGVRVLVVDDTPINLKVVQGLLSKSKVAIDVAESGVIALELAIINKYDLIFMDHMMPEMDGYETMVKIKEYPNCINEKTPFVVLTANAIVGAKDEYLKMGFDDYLSKPVRKEELENMIKQYAVK